jgi:hypothetical protein
LQWIKDLDSDEFDVRETASMELTRCAEQAEVQLRKALGMVNSVEVQHRLEQIVGTLDAKVMPPERLQALRGLSVLEKLATPEAVAIVEKLAQGPENDWLTARAKQSLQRITLRKNDRPN